VSGQHKERPKYDKSNGVHMDTPVKGKTKIGNNAQQLKIESNVSIKHSGQYYATNIYLK
jgi:hypothetical protein